MRAGKLRNRVEIQARAITQDSFGDGIPTWTTEAVRWASVEIQSGREVWVASGLNADLGVLITMRHYEGLTPRHRLKMGDRIFNVESAVSDGLQHLVLCKEVV